MSSDEAKPWRKYDVADDAMLLARPEQPTEAQAALCDAAFTAGFLLAERIAASEIGRGSVGGTQ